MDIVAYAKSHPAQTAAIAVIGVAAVWLLLPSGNSGNSATASGGVSSDALLNAQLQLAQIQGQSRAQINQYNSELAITKENNAAQLALAQMQIQGQNNSAVEQYDYLSYRDTLASKTDLSNIAANLTIQNQTLKSQESVALAGVNANLQIAQGQNQVAITQAGFARDMTNILADVQRQQIVTQGQVAQTQINSGVQIAKIQAGSAQTAGILGLVGNVLRL